MVWSELVNSPIFVGGNPTTGHTSDHWTAPTGGAKINKITFENANANPPQYLFNTSGPAVQDVSPTYLLEANSGESLSQEISTSTGMPDVTNISNWKLKINFNRKTDPGPFHIASSYGADGINTYPYTLGDWHLYFQAYHTTLASALDILLLSSVWQLNLFQHLRVGDRLSRFTTKYKL